MVVQLFCILRETERDVPASNASREPARTRRHGGSRPSMCRPGCRWPWAPGARGAALPAQEPAIHSCVTSFANKTSKWAAGGTKAAGRKEMLSHVCDLRTEALP